MDTLPPDQQSSTSAWGAEQTLLVTDQELNMNAELVGISGDLSVMYRGAKYSLLNENDPDCLRHASVSMRSLIRDLHKKDDRIPSGPDNTMQGDEIARLKNKWLPIVGFHDKPLDELTGNQPALIKSYMTQSKTFFDWHDGHSVTAREFHQLLINTYDPRQNSLPEEDREKILNAWMEYDRYFNKVTHEPSESSLKEFKERLSGFEELFLTLVSPHTGSDFEKMDELIAEIEND